MGKFIAAILPVLAATTVSATQMDLTGLYTSCNQDDLEQQVIQDMSNVNLFCEDRTLWNIDTIDAADQSIIMKCKMQCQTGTVINNSNHQSAELADHGVFTCMKMRGGAFSEYKYYFRYEDSNDDTDIDDFGGCVASDCWLPHHLKNKRANDLFTWTQRWQPQNEAADDSFIQHLNFHLYLRDIQAAMPTADFATNGYTIIIKMKAEMAGSVFVDGGSNVNARNDGSTTGYGKTFSFTSSYFNRGDLAKDVSTIPIVTDANAAEKKAQRIEFNIYFYAKEGTTLPAMGKRHYTGTTTPTGGSSLAPAQKINKVQILEGEYTNTECLNGVYDSFAERNSGGDLVFISSGAAAFVRASGTFDFNPVVSQTCN